MTLDPTITACSMSAVSRRIAHNSAHARIAHARRRNYAFLAEALAPIPGMQLLHSVYRTARALSPCRWLRRIRYRFTVISRAAASGTELFWSDFHPTFPIEAFADAAFLKTHVVTLPIHQDLDHAQLDRIAGVVHEWRRSP